MKDLIDQLEEKHTLSRQDFALLIEHRTEEVTEYLFSKSVRIRKKYYGDAVYIRGLIEFSNYCKNDCLYCGIRRSNAKVKRYRLSKEEILECCRHGYDLGFRTFVLQGGEDVFFTDEKLVDIISQIRRNYADCAITLSFGERKRQSYQSYFEAGAHRYLLRHETADHRHYDYLHPSELSLENRKKCLFDLKEIGFQVGSGFMVGSPGQTADSLAQDMRFLAELQPHMVGIGPFIPHRDTPFSKKKAGTTELTLFMLALTRLMLPKALLPSTTALGTISPEGREKGILVGANVVMPNLSPLHVRKKYLLYNDKICTGDEAAESCIHLKMRMKEIGYRIVTDRGDAL